MIVKLALLLAGCVCIVSHALGIEAGHELHQHIFLAISIYAREG